jgi:hypothetical protein
MQTPRFVESIPYCPVCHGVCIYSVRTTVIADDFESYRQPRSVRNTFTADGFESYRQFLEHRFEAYRQLLKRLREQIRELLRPVVIYPDRDFDSVAIKRRMIMTVAFRPLTVPVRRGDDGGNAGRVLPAMSDLPMSLRRFDDPMAGELSAPFAALGAPGGLRRVSARKALGVDGWARLVLLDGGLTAPSLYSLNTSETAGDLSPGDLPDSTAGGSPLIRPFGLRFHGPLRDFLPASDLDGPWVAPSAASDRLRSRTGVGSPVRREDPADQGDSVLSGHSRRSAAVRERVYRLRVPNDAPLATPLGLHVDGQTLLRDARRGWRPAAGSRAGPTAVSPELAAVF